MASNASEGAEMRREMCVYFSEKQPIFANPVKTLAEQHQRSFKVQPTLRNQSPTVIYQALRKYLQSQNAFT